LNLTPKALANFSDNPDERVRQLPNPFQGLMVLLIVNPGFSLCSNPGLKLANAFGVKFKLRHHYPAENPAETELDSFA
jgi:hypothetical protein